MHRSHWVKAMTDWALLLNEGRRRESRGSAHERTEGRTELERDYDRILFSTPIRRLADKTQVYPLEAHDAVRTRLTHSHEVSALARAVGSDLVARFGPQIGIPADTIHLRNVSALMAAVGLVHDLGNPPFGHQGERAIRRWFEGHLSEVFTKGSGVSDEMQKDFVRFEGNAQTFRLVTRLQSQRDEFGLNLTYGTLAALLKYSVPAHRSDPGVPFAGAHKPGFFQSEGGTAEEAWRETGLRPEQRHPLTYLVEACDDIAYSVIDAEDTVKKDLASYADLRSHLEDGGEGAPPNDFALIGGVLAYTDQSRQEYLKSAGIHSRSPAELDDLSMQRFRVAAISQMIGVTLTTFVEHFGDIAAGSFEGDLLSASSASTLRRLLKEFLQRIAYPHRSVLEIELRGSIVISRLMSRLWTAIIDREDPAQPKSRRPNPLSAYTYSRISENYRRVFEDSTSTLPVRYREAQLLSDMVAGMTDSFAVSLLGDLERFGDTA